MPKSLAVPVQHYCNAPLEVLYSLILSALVVKEVPYSSNVLVFRILWYKVRNTEALRHESLGTCSSVDLLKRKLPRFVCKKCMVFLF